MLYWYLAKSGFFNDKTLQDKPTKGISRKDYAANFRQFMDERKDGEPFYFWYGGHEPHLKCAETGHSDSERAKVTVPKFLPNTESSQEMLLDYADEIHHFDTQLGKIIATLDAAGELDNTLIIVTADNGMPMPRAKSNGYDYGIHVPLSIRWGKAKEKGTVINAPVGFVDLSATILEAVGIAIPDQFVGESLLGLLNGDIDQLDDNRAVFSGRERHSSSRYQNLSYPQRMMRCDDFLIIWNPKPDRYPAGAPRRIEGGELTPPQSAYHDIDDSMIKRELLAKKRDPYIGQFFHLAVDKRPEWQFYNVKDDPANLKDLSGEAEHARLFSQFKDQLTTTLKDTGDPRVLGYGDIWEDYPRLKGQMRYFPSPESQ